MSEADKGSQAPSTNPAAGNNPLPAATTNPAPPSDSRIADIERILREAAQRIDEGADKIDRAVKSGRFRSS